MRVMINKKYRVTYTNKSGKELGVEIISATSRDKVEAKANKKAKRFGEDVIPLIELLE